MNRPDVVVIGAFLWLTGCGSAPMATSAVRDSAGVEIIDHPAEVLARAPVWTIDTTLSSWSIGGGDDPDQDVDNLTCLEWRDGGAWTCHQNPTEIRRYDSLGRVALRFGRKGMGPGEFQSPRLLEIRGDTLELWDGSLARVTSYQTDGRLVGTIAFNGLPRSRTSGVRGRLGSGRLVAIDYAWAGAGGDLGGARGEMPVYLLSADGTTADSLPGHPGYRQYRGVVYEGGQSFVSGTMYELDGATLIAVDPDGFTVALPDTAELIRRGPDGAVRRIIRLGLPRRPVTEADREAYIARDSIEYSKVSPQFVSDMMKNYRGGRFVDHLTPFEAILKGPDGELWLERSWLRPDSAKQYVIVDGEGMVAATFTLPMWRSLLWIGSDAVLTSWRDADDVRRISRFPLHRTPAP